MTRGSAVIILGAVAAALTVAVIVGPGGRKQAAQTAPSTGPNPGPPNGDPSKGGYGMFSTPFIWPGIRCPPVQPAAAVKLDDDAPVAGVVVRGKARAYLLKTMSKMTGHVVNDLVGDTPVTVTYCDKSDCVCGFTADTPGKPLDVYLGGFGGKLMLKVGNTFYWQDTTEPTHNNNPQPFPYQKLALEKTTWKKWRAAHPDTEVYTEMPPEPRMGGHDPSE